jgi:predicted extracellular nuclease
MPMVKSSLLHIIAGYQFGGAFGSLDHGVASPSMRSQVHISV